MSAKEDIIQAAKKLFATKGFENTSVREIALEAGVNNAAINYHFQSKAELFCSICRDFAQGRLFHSYEILTPVENLEEMRIKLELFFNSLLSHAKDESETVLIILKNIEFFASSSPDDFRNLFLVLHDKLAQFFSDAQSKKLLRAEIDCEILAHIFISGTTELLKSHQLKKEFLGVDIMNPETREHYKKTFVSSFIYGIGG